MKKLAWIPLVFLLMIGVVQARCEAYIYALNVPSNVNSGEPVTVSARIQLKAGGLDRKCRFLVEAGIVPQNVPFSLLATVNPSQPFQCCPGSLNFEAQYFDLECPMWELYCEKSVDVELHPRAPAEGYCDHCGHMYDNPNPSCSEDPNFFWKGEGWYVGYLGVFKGCYYDLVQRGEEQVQYALRTFSIYVRRAGPSPWPTCGNGICDVGENLFTCPSDCLKWDTQIIGPLTLGDLVIIIAIIVVIAIIIKVVK